jgi:nucleotide-binding universal stress UspA family protein
LCDTGGLVLLVDGSWTAQQLGGAVLTAAVRRADAVAAGVAPSRRLLWGPPAGALIEVSRGAGLLVLGGREPERPGSRPGSLTRRVAARAGCPVAVIRLRPRTSADPPRPRVVVGVDPSHCAPATFEFAFRAAGRRGVPLIAVHAWGGDPPADLEGVCGSAATGEARAALDRTLGPWQRRFPDVPVEAQVVRADPGAALVAESSGAALVVVGSRSRGGLLGALLATRPPARRSVLVPSSGRAVARGHGRRRSSLGTV